MSQTDKGSYKLVAKNEKGEATSQQVEITEIPEEKGEKPQIIKHLRSLVCYIIKYIFLLKFYYIKCIYLLIIIHKLMLTVNNYLPIG